MTVLSRRPKTRPVRVVVSGEEADGRESPHMVVPFLAVPGKATGSTPEGKENFDRVFGWAFDPPAAAAAAAAVPCARVGLANRHLPDICARLQDLASAFFSPASFFDV